MLRGKGTGRAKLLGTGGDCEGEGNDGGGGIWTATFPRPH